MPQPRLYETNAARQAAYPKRVKRNARALRNAAKDEWGTPPEWVELARTALGSIDLDPASNAAAQAVVRATRWYSKADDGLAQSWAGRVFLNPPYSRGLIDVFTEKLVAEHDAGRVTAAVLLVNAATSSDWFKALLARFPVCWVAKRIAFLNADGRPQSGNTRTQAVFYLGDDASIFERVFGVVGKVTRP